MRTTTTLFYSSDSLYPYCSHKKVLHTVKVVQNINLQTYFLQPMDSVIVIGSMTLLVIE